MLAMLQDLAASQIKPLFAANIRITMISVLAEPAERDLVARAVKMVASRSDLVGTLGDGSIAIMSLFPGRIALENHIDEKFLPRLKVHLLVRTEGGPVGPLHIRAVERSSLEFGEPNDLFTTLMGSPDVSLTTTIRQPAGIMFGCLGGSSVRDTMRSPRIWGTTGLAAD